MKNIITALGLFLIPVLFSHCGGKTVFGEESKLSTQPLSISQALQTENLDREIKLKGRVKAICPDDACWLAVTDVANTMRIEFKDGKITPPYSLGEVPVLLEGRIVMKIIAPDSKGFGDYEKSCGLEKVTQTTRVPVMIAYRMEIINE